MFFNRTLAQTSARPAAIELHFVERKPVSVRPKPQPLTTGRKQDHFRATDPRRGKVGGYKREVRRRGRNTARSLIRNAPRAKLVRRSLYVRNVQKID